MIKPIEYLAAFSDLEPLEFIKEYLNPLATEEGAMDMPFHLFERAVKNALWQLNFVNQLWMNDYQLLLYNEVREQIYQQTLEYIHHFFWVKKQAYLETCDIIFKLWKGM